MQITKGSSIVETLDSLVSAKKIFNMSEDRPILVVEGKDDIEVISKYYYYLNKLPSFKVVLAEDIDKSNDTNGKSKVLEMYETHKKEFQKIFCLLDRDFDFILGENKVDANIFYYHFYELENYLFDDSVLKLFFVRFFNCTSLSDFEQLTKELGASQKIFFPYSMLGLFRELHYRNRTTNLGELEIEHLAKVVKQSPNSILQNKLYEDLGNEDKIITYFIDKLEEIGLLLDDLFEDVNDVAGDFELVDDDQLSFFKYFISGKLILSALQTLANKFETLPFKSSGSTISLENSIKKEWIPSQSMLYKELIQGIENRI